MGHVVKIQRVDRGRTRSFYLNFPAALADVMQVEKGEAFEWLLEDKCYAPAFFVGTGGGW